MKRILSIVTILVLGTSSAQAGVMIEPFVSYGVSGELDVNTAHGVKGDVNFLSFGARLAYQMLGFFVGGEYAMYPEKTISSTGTSTGNFKYKMNGISAVAGYEFPLLLRAYAGYTFSYTGTLTGTNQADFEKGDGFLLGAGYTGLPFISINLEFRSHNIKESVVSGVTTNNVDGTDTQILLGVSAPIGIPFL